jgi:hypothetical protein
MYRYWILSISSILLILTNSTSLPKRTQSGGLAATTSAYEDNLLLSTRSNYIFPRTGCRILGANRIYFGDNGEVGIGMEILLRQDVAVSVLTDDSPDNTTATMVVTGPISYDRVYKHVSRGFSGGTGGKNKFKMLLMAEDEATGLTIQPFQELEDVSLIKRLHNPIPLITHSPSRVPTRFPTNVATNIKQPSTQASIMTPTKTPTKSYQKQASPPGDIILTNLPTNVNDRPLAPGKESMGIDDFSSSGSVPPINHASEPQNSNDRDDIIPMAVVAAAVGAFAGIFVVGLLSLYRYRKELQEYWRRDRRQLPVASAVPMEKYKGRTRGWGSIPSHLSNFTRARESMAPQQHLVGARPPPPIPTIVNEEERSLAESTLGDRTAGRRVWSAPPPPVQFLQSSWIPGEGRHIPSASGVSIAISQISSLDSGTIGAGGGAATIGEFSLEAAIKDDDTRSSDAEIDGVGQPSAKRDENTPGRLGGGIVNDDTKHRGSGENAGCSQGPAARENSSSKDAASATNNCSANASNVTPHNAAGHLEPPLDLTPRISGRGGGPWKSPTNMLVDQEDCSENDEASSTDDLGYTLPRAITPERRRSAALETSSSPWSLAFAQGTAAVLSASFRGAENLTQPPPTPPQVSGGTPWPGSPAAFLLPVGDMSHIDGLVVRGLSDKSISEIKDTDDTPADADDNRWLLKVVAGALGPPAKGADLESLSGRSNPSMVSAQSAPVWSSTSGQGKREKASRKSSTRSEGSRSSRCSQGSEESSSIAIDLTRLEVQVKMLNDREKKELPTGASSATDEMPSPPPPPPPPPPTSPLSRNSATSSIRLDVRAPPGRLGVILANKSDGRGTVVSALRTSSVLVGKILPGDVLVAVDGLDVGEMHVSEVTAIMSNKAQQEKILTVVTPTKSERR